MIKGRCISLERDDLFKDIVQSLSPCAEYARLQFHPPSDNL